MKIHAVLFACCTASLAGPIPAPGALQPNQSPPNAATPPHNANERLTPGPRPLDNLQNVDKRSVYSASRSQLPGTASVLPDYAYYDTYYQGEVPAYLDPNSLYSEAEHVFTAPRFLYDGEWRFTPEVFEQEMELERPAQYPLEDPAVPVYFQNGTPEMSLRNYRPRVPNNVFGSQFARQETARANDLHDNQDMTRPAALNNGDVWSLEKKSAPKKAPRGLVQSPGTPSAVTDVDKTANEIGQLKTSLNQEKRRYFPSNVPTNSHTGLKNQSAHAEAPDASAASAVAMSSNPQWQGQPSEQTPDPLEAELQEEATRNQLHAGRDVPAAAAPLPEQLLAAAAATPPRAATEHTVNLPATETENAYRTMEKFLVIADILGRVSI